MEEKKKRGRGNPHPNGRVFDKTLGICLTTDEMEKLNDAHKKYMEANGVKISKSQYVRLQLKEIIG